MFHPIPVIFVLLFVRLRKCFVEVSLWWDHHPHIQTIPLKQPIRRPRYKENTKITRTSSAKTIWAKHRANKKQLKHQHFVLLMSWRYKPHSIFLWWNLSTTSGFFSCYILSDNHSQVPFFATKPATILFLLQLSTMPISLQGLCWDNISQNLPSLQLSSRCTGGENAQDWTHEVKG